MRVLLVRMARKPPVSTRDLLGQGAGRDRLTSVMVSGRAYISVIFPHLAFAPRLRPERSLPKGRWPSWRKPSMTWKVKSIFLCTPETFTIGPYYP